MKTYIQKNDKLKYSDHWSTPKEIYDFYINQRYFDPCLLYDNNFHMNPTIKYNNLFINPPYSDIKTWVNYAIEYYKIHKNHIVILVPSRTDTKWFHELLNYDIDVEFIKGRLKFGGSKNTAPFPSIIIHLGKNVNIRREN
jgi:site-specific DNA-methyltransferase (adenine-specific)